MTDDGAGEDEVIGNICEEVGDNDDRHSSVDNAREIAGCVLHFAGDEVDLSLLELQLIVMTDHLHCPSRRMPTTLHIAQ